VDGVEWSLEVLAFVAGLCGVDFEAAFEDSALVRRSPIVFPVFPPLVSGVFDEPFFFLVLFFFVGFSSSPDVDDCVGGARGGIARMIGVGLDVGLDVSMLAHVDLGVFVLEAVLSPLSVCLSVCLCLNN